MNNKTNKKLLSFSIIFILFWAAISLAYTDNNFIIVKPILNRAVQSIRSIVFNEDAIRHSDNLGREVVVENNHGNMMIRWRVLMAVEGTNNTLTTWSAWSSLFYWRDNYLGGTDSYIIAWDSNTLEDNVSWSMIIWGTDNRINLWENDYIIWGTRNLIDVWNDDFIIWGHDNLIENSNYAYIIGWSNSKIRNGAHNSFAAGSDILIDKKNVFAWKDTSDDVVLNPKKEKTFTMFAMNWMTIGYDHVDKSKEPIAWTVDVKWIFQVADEAKECGLNIAGAIQYTWWLYGCFCTCNGKGWVSLVPSSKCRTMCSSIHWPNDENYKQWVCRYKQDSNWHIPTIWRLDASQWCDNWEAVDFHEDDYWWTWKCKGVNNSLDNCQALKKHENGQCSVNSKFPNIADYNTKCAGWYAFDIKRSQPYEKNMYSWTCRGINWTSTATGACISCKNNWTFNGVDTCENHNWECNTKFHKQNFGSLAADDTKDGKGLCTIWTVDSFAPTIVDWVIKWWTWKCKRLSEDASDASCSATRIVQPGRCKSTTVENIYKYWVCDRGEFTGVTIDSENMATWTCAGINHSTSQENCKWCPDGFKYNRKRQKCIPITCEYTPWWSIDENNDSYILATCHQRIELKRRNVWAAQINDPWYYFQWWNNHWFSSYELWLSSTLTGKRVPWSDEYNRKGYSWEFFIMQKDGENEASYYNYWVQDGGKWTIHRDIWWWGMDWRIAWNFHSHRWVDSLFTVVDDEIEELIDDYKFEYGTNFGENYRKYMLNTWVEARQWPCDTWWHVPSAWEWGALLTNWCETYPAKCTNDDGKYGLQKWRNLSSITNKEHLGAEFLDWFSLPMAWIAMPSTYYNKRIISSWDAAYYWSSTAESDEYISYLWVNNNQIYATKWDGEMRWWIPIRCFKNPDILDNKVLIRNMHLSYIPNP